MGSEDCPEEAKSLYRDAGALFDKNQFQDAIKLYDRAIEKCDDYSSAYFNRALCYALINDYEKARQDVLKVLQLQPAAADAKYVLGLIEEYQGNYEEAVRLYGEALKLDPNYQPARARLESTKARLGKGGDDQGRSSSGNPLADLFDPDGDKQPQAAKASSEGGEAQAERKPRKRTRAGRKGRGGKEVVETEIGDEKGIEIVGFSFPTRTFKDVVDLESVKKKVRERVIVALRRPSIYKKYDYQPKMNMLMYGPPGCGKTYVAEAVAGELRAPFVALDVAEILSAYFGESEKNIKKVFETAEKLAEKKGICVLFFDELDSIGINRMQLYASDSETYRNVVSQLMESLNRVSQVKGLILLAATNRPWDVDPALRRSGRLTEHLYVPPPDKDARLALLKMYLGKAPLLNLDLEEVALATEGFSSSDMSSLVDEAKARAIERENEELDKRRKNPSYVPKQSGVTTEDFLGVIREKVVRPSLYVWYSELLREVASEPQIAQEYADLIEDAKKYDVNKNERSEDRGYVL
ncbi:MAG: AAA family ATPase [TACK group archaeon]|nr:AAA family ATPase [TACK group archaeon]